MNFSSLTQNPVKTLLVGACTVGVGALLWYLADDGKKSTSQKGVVRRLSKEQIVTILEEIEGDLFSILTNLATYALNIKQQTQYKIPDAELRQILEKDETLNALDEIINKVYAKFNVSEAEVEAGVARLGDDPEIREMQERMRKKYDDVFQGVHPVPNSKVPDFLTEDVLLKVFSELHYITQKAIYQKFLELQESGVKISMADPQVTEALNGINLEEIRKVFLATKLAQCRDNPERVLQSALHKYKQSSRAFGIKYTQMEQSHQRTLQMLVSGKLEVFQLDPAMEEGTRGIALEASDEPLIQEITPDA